MTALAAMLKWFGACVCRMKKRHAWTTGYYINFAKYPELRTKRCKRCGLTQTVKPRNRKPK